MDMIERAKLYEHAIMRFQEAVNRTDDGLFSLRAESARDLDVDPVVFADLKRSLDETNRKIREGEIDVASIEPFSFD